MRGWASISLIRPVATSADGKSPGNAWAPAIVANASKQIGPSTSASSGVPGRRVVAALAGAAVGWGALMGRLSYHLGAGAAACRSRFLDQAQHPRRRPRSLAQAQRADEQQRAAGGQRSQV